MLAKELKIQNIKRQREFITGLLEHPKQDGNTACVYYGYVFPEVIAYFQEEGFRVDEVSSGTDTSQFYPVYLFTISDKLTLNKDEKEKAEKIDCSFERDSMDPFAEFLRHISDANF